VGVSMVRSLVRRVRKRRVLRRREGMRGIGPVRLNREDIDVDIEEDIEDGSIIWSLWRLDECCLCCCWMLLVLLLSK